jgi:tetratricopeptide (TPR) repeat protein
VSNLIIGLLGAVLATNQPLAVSNLVAETVGISVKAPDPNDPVEKEYQKLLDADDAAEQEVDRWIRDNEAFASKGAGVSREDLNRKIRERFRPVKEAYEAFISKHSDHARVRIAYGSFLNDLGDEDGALTQYRKAIELNPKDPAPYNNAANIYTHSGPVTNAFSYFARAIELNASEPVYYHNLATTVYLFRPDAQEYYHLNEQQVFDKAFQLYSNSMRLDPNNFPLASDVAQTYYGVKPMRTEDALNAWTNAFKLAADDIEREGVHLHFARIKLGAGRFAEARCHLDAVNDDMYAELKKRLTRRLEEEMAKPSSGGVQTNEAAAAVTQ